MIDGRAHATLKPAAASSFDDDVGRASRVAFTFGAGPHACSGEAIAVAIAAAGVEALLKSGLDPTRLGAPVGYRRSANVRMALWSRP
jgi:cytochrome P450